MAQPLQTAAEGGTSPTRKAPSSRPPSRLTLWLTAALGAVLIAGGITALVRHRAATNSSSQSALASFMGITQVPGRHLAPDFTLADQNGQPVSLDGLRDKAVVLEFMDSHCTDICPIISQEFVAAHRDLGTRAGNTVFLAVNVNPWHAAQADVAAFTDNEGLNRVPEWHFVTGTPAELQAVWKAYGITVIAPNATADVQHSDTMFFIDPTGTERYVAEPTDEHAANGTAFLPPPQIAEWGHGIADYAAKLAPH